VEAPVQGREEVGLPSPNDPEAAREVAVPAVQPITSAFQAAEDSLSIVFVTPEAHPFASTGGLAEVAAALPLALAAAGHAVTLVLPRYRDVEVAGTTAIPLAFCLGSRDVTVTVLERRLPNGILAAFVDAPDLFDRSGLYGDDSGDYPDNAWRFALFSRAALEYVRARKHRPSVIHAHDW
jgi:starch synthase